jgi:hypothetical protein
MARPKINPDDKKDRLIQIKFSSYDKKRLNEVAKSEHLTVNALIRKWIMDKLNGK